MAEREFTPIIVGRVSQGTGGVNTSTVLPFLVEDSNNGGFFNETVSLCRYFIDVPDDARIVSVTTKGFSPVITDAGFNPLVKAEFYNQWNGVPTLADKTNPFLGGAVSVLASTLTPVTVVTVNQINMIPRHGLITLRYMLTGVINPTGVNTVSNNPSLTIRWTRTGQPTLIEPLNNTALAVSQPIVAKWFHNNGDGLGQGRYILEVNINGAGWAVELDSASSNQQHTFNANRFAVNSTVQWRVKTYALGEADLPSEVSGIGQFVVRPAPVTPVVTGPVGQISSALPSTTWTSLEAGRTHFETRRTRLSDNMVIDSSGEQPGQALVWPAGTRLSDNANYKDEVRVKSQFAVWSAWAVSNFFTVFNPPPRPLVVVDPRHLEGYNLLVITNPVPVGAEDVALFNIIERLKEDGLTWEVIKQEWPTGVVYRDYMARSKQLETYRVTAVGTTGGEKPSLTASATLNLQKGIWIHDLYDPEGTALNIEGFEGSFNDEWRTDVEFFKYEGRAGFVASEDEEHEETDFTGSFFILTRMTPFFPVNKWPLFEALIRRRSEYGVRTHAGGRFKGKIPLLAKALGESNGMMHGYATGIKMIGTDIKEADI